MTPAKGFFVCMPLKMLQTKIQPLSVIALEALVLACTINYTVSQKNDTDVAHYDFNAHQLILVIFGRDVTERVCYQMVIGYLTSPN